VDSSQSQDPFAPDAAPLSDTAAAEEASAQELAPPNSEPGVDGPGTVNTEIFPDAVVPDTDTPGDLRDLSKPDLQAHAAGLGVPVSGTKDEIASRIEAAQPDSPAELDPPAEPAATQQAAGQLEAPAATQEATDVPSA
jgi:hypothetical protein